MATFGYAGKILKVDLSSGNSTQLSTSDYAERFLGGRGIASKLYWDEVSPEVKAFDAESRLIFATGPLAGLPAVSGSRWIVCGKSPAHTTEQFCYCNLGGRWGAELKFAGYDAMVVHGKSENPVYIFLHDDKVEVKDAYALWGMGSIKTREILMNELGNSVRVVTIGPAGESRAVMASLFADKDASGSGGLGAVMGSKNLKAIVVRGCGRGVKAAHPERFRELADYFRELRRIPAMTSFNRISPDPLGELRKIPGFKTMKKDRCYGCFKGCGRLIYEAKDGQKGKFMCHSGMFYQLPAEAYYGDWNDVPFYANKLCDEYGVDTKAVDMMGSWLQECYKAGILGDEDVGIPVSKAGSLEFIETLVRKVSMREGFGDMLAQGITKAAEAIGPAAKEQIKFAGYFSRRGNSDLYSPRIYITNALIYAMEPRTPIQQIHEVGILMAKWLRWARGLNGGIVSSEIVRAIASRFWGSALAGDFSTYDGKALAVKMIQDRQYAKECLILCDLWWPIIDLEQTPDHVGDPTLESKMLSAVIGNEVDEQGLYKIGERIVNLQRAILAREGHRGRQFDILPESWHTDPVEREFFNVDCLVPGKDGEIISRKGAVVNKEGFERMKSEYYGIRQWDTATGLQTRANLEKLGMKDIAADMEARGLLV